MSELPSVSSLSDTVRDPVRRRFVGLSAYVGTALAMEPMKVWGQLVASAMPTALTLTQFGADPFGQRDSTAAFVEAVKIASRTGAMLVGDPSHTYKIDRTVRLHVSDLAIDLKNATITGDGVVIFDGDSGIDGDWSKALHNIHVRNVRFGTGRGFGSNTKAFRFLFCVDSSMSNIVRHSYGDTGIEMFMCKRTVFSNIVSRGGKDQTHGGAHLSGGAIAALMLHCEQCTFKGVHAQEGPFVIGIQVKGGSANLVTQCSISNVRSGSHVNMMRYGFYNRGDAPWEASPTPGYYHGGYSYPYIKGSWNREDSRRASVDTKITDCTVENCENVQVAFQTEQFIGGSMTNCRSLDNHGGSSFAISSTPHGQERYFTIEGCESVGPDNFGIAIVGNKNMQSPFTGIVIKSNTISSSGYSGIYATEVSGLVIRNNSIVDSCLHPSTRYDAAILARSSSGILLEDNHLQSLSGCSGKALLISLGNGVVHTSGNIFLDRLGSSCATP